MKQTRIALALIVTSLAATPALAASLTMLQFGSFETRDEAQKKLTDITSKYADTLGTMPTSIREVKLPPDNLTVYRTQAGPVADRAAAQSICSKLSNSGDECYIVQTAMVNATAPATAVASATPSTPSVSLSTPSALPPATLSTSTGSTSAMPDLTSSMYSLHPDTTSTLASATMATAPTFSNAAADPSPDMQSALDRAAANQPAVAADVNDSTAAAAQQSHASFWSHLNPFTSNNTAKPVVTKTPVVTAPPIDAVASEPLPAPMPEVTSPVVTASPMVVPPAMTPIVATPHVVTPVASAAVAAPVAVAASTPNVGFDNSPVITQAPVMQLPPPPAPLKAQDRTMLTSAHTPLPAPESVAAPIATTNAPAVITPVNGTVQVEEAKRVPVTTTTTMPAQIPSGALATPFVQAPVNLHPNSSEGMKTLWAQIGSFASNDDALAYWANYRQNHPDFPVVRVRVTSSYQQLIHGVNTYSLRVGPIAQRAFVSNLCASLSQVPEGQPQPPAMKCGVVNDLGVSSALTPAPGMLPTSRYSARH